MVDEPEIPSSLARFRPLAGFAAIAGILLIWAALAGASCGPCFGL
jgi:hypothetical protein